MSYKPLLADLRAWLDRGVIRVHSNVWHCQYCHTDGETAETIAHRDRCPVRLIILAVDALDSLTGGD